MIVYLLLMAGTALVGIALAGVIMGGVAWLLCLALKRFCPHWSRARTVSVAAAIGPLFCFFNAAIGMFGGDGAGVSSLDVQGLAIVLIVATISIGLGWFVGGWTANRAYAAEP